jgi:hypothetical protein
MSFNNGFTAVTGATYTAAQYNTHVRDNFTAIWVYTTQGDIAYATGGASLSRLGIGAAGYQLFSNGSAPVWVDGTRYIPTQLNADAALITGDNAGQFFIPPALNGWNITYVGATRNSGTGVLTLQLRNITDGVDVLTTKLTIDSGETYSGDAATPAVIDLSKDDVAAGDRFSWDGDNAGINTLYCIAMIGLMRP